MTPKFRAYDGGSLNRMYKPDEVMVGNGDIWIIDEDSVAGEWIVNNDIHLMQTTGLFDRNGLATSMKTRGFWRKKNETRKN